MFHGINKTIKLCLIIIIPVPRPYIYSKTYMHNSYIVHGISNVQGASFSMAI